MIDPFDKVSPEWAVLAPSLDDYDEAKVRDSLKALIQKIPASSSENSQNQVEEVLQAEIPVWYGGDSWHVGYEILGGCWCHSFEREYEKGPDAAAAWVITELTRMHGILLSLRSLFKEFGIIESDKDWRNAIEKVYSIFVKETGCNESWYMLLEDGLVWLFEACGAKPIDRDWILERISLICSSFVEPETAKWKALVGEMVEKQVGS